ncbi:nuclear transcription factor Y subunit C10 [Hordeum vulgare]|nr:nuclear transcription factor Y subunit C10 [Hordeum vulgare]
MPDPNPPRQVHGVRIIRPRALPITPTPPPLDVRYVPVPFPFPSAPIGATATAEGLMILPPINHATTGRAFFLDRNSGTSFEGENSAAETMASPPPAGPAESVAQPSVYPAAYYLCSYPLTNDVEDFAVGNTDPIVIPPEIVEGNVADGNGDGGPQQHQSANVGVTARVWWWCSEAVMCWMLVLAVQVGCFWRRSSWMKTCCFPTPSFSRWWALHLVLIRRISSSTKMFSTTSLPTRAAAPAAAEQKEDQSGTQHRLIQSSPDITTYMPSAMYQIWE